jgi:hypothetical protein
MKSRIIVIACLLLLTASVAGAGERTVVYNRDGYWDAYHQCIIPCAKDDKPCMDKCAERLSKKDRESVGVMKTCLDIHKGEPYAYESCRENLSTRVVVGPSWTTENKPIIEIQIVPSRSSYEYKIIPEADLDTWLNDGWECERVYSVVERTYPYKDWKDENPVNKAIIKRKVQ